MSLKNRTFTAVRWTSASAIFKGLLQIIQLAVLARLLTPEDFGLMAMVMVVLGFATLLADLGLNSAYIQRQEVSHSQRSSLFWANLGMSASLMLLLIAFSPLLANFFGDERLTPLLMLSATIFTLNALGQQIRANAEKTLDFKPLVLTEISAASLGFIIAIGCAWLGFGVYALVYGSITTAFLSSLLAWLFINKGWHPKFYCSLHDVKSFLGFGGAVVGNNIVNQFNASMDILIGGRLLGATQLGLYSLPRNLVLQIQSLINPIITRVGFPLIAQIQHDIPKVRSVYLQTINLTASVNAPIYLGFAFFVPEVVQVLFGGNNWTGSVELLRLLAIWGLFRSLGNPVGSLLLGMGRADLSLKWNIGLLFLVFPVLWLGSQWEVTGMAWAMLIFQVAMFIPGWLILVKPLCGATLVEYSKAAFSPTLIVLLIMTPIYFLTRTVSHPLMTLLIVAITFPPIYLYTHNRLNSTFNKAILGFIRR